MFACPCCLHDVRHFVYWLHPAAPDSLVVIRELSIDTCIPVARGGKFICLFPDLNFICFFLCDPFAFDRCIQFSGIHNLIVLVSGTLRIS